jgi:SAM-dependent methyltransferase
VGRDHRLAEVVVKRFAPAAERNREPLRAVLGQVLPERGRVLEVASGSGQHAVHFARCFPHLTWQPSDVDADALASVEAWRREAGLDNLAPPVHLDAGADAWPVAQAEAVININMIHIAPWWICQGLMTGAARLLPPGGLLFLYGPFFVRARETAPSNLAFDRSLRAQNPAWGLRHLHQVEDEARAHGLVLEDTHDMPANNLSVVLRKRA